MSALLLPSLVALESFPKWNVKHIVELVLLSCFAHTGSTPLISLLTLMLNECRHNMSHMFYSEDSEEGSAMQRINCDPFWARIFHVKHLLNLKSCMTAMSSASRISIWQAFWWMNVELLAAHLEQGAEDVSQTYQQLAKRYKISTVELILTLSRVRGYSISGRMEEVLK